MGAPKLSDWLDGKPPFVGLWQVRPRAATPWGWCWWDGRTWGAVCRIRATARELRDFEGEYQRLQYRGHAQPSKEFLRRSA